LTSSNSNSDTTHNTADHTLQQFKQAKSRPLREGMEAASQVCSTVWDFEDPLGF